MGNLLDRNALLAKEKLQIVKLEFEGGDFVYLREMTGHERDLFEQSMLKKNRDKNGTVIGYEQSIEDFRAKLAVNTLCNEAGESLLKPEDYVLLSRNMGAKRLDLIATKAQELNAITEKDKEELVKNSVADLENSSNSGSAKN
jgi:DNA-directed RNA polymerase alpha subunit